MSAASARKSGDAPSAPPPAPPSFPAEPASSRQTKVATFTIGADEFAVLSVPLDDGSLTAALSEAEREVAMLAAKGMKNAEIARRRGTSTRTVANQMASILRKLGVSSRYALAARLAHCPLGDDER
jgi:DNA-binding CsgD family transcriptional regulator